MLLGAAPMDFLDITDYDLVEEEDAEAGSTPGVPSAGEQLTPECTGIVVHSLFGGQQQGDEVGASWQERACHTLPALPASRGSGVLTLPNPCCACVRRMRRRTTGTLGAPGRQAHLPCPSLCRACGTAIVVCTLPPISDNAVLTKATGAPGAQVKFTCNLCGETTTRRVNPHAWANGTVFAECSGCHTKHKLIGAPPICMIRHEPPATCRLALRFASCARRTGICC